MAGVGLAVGTESYAHSHLLETYHICCKFQTGDFFFTLFTVSPRSIRKKKEREKKLAKSHIYISKCHHFQEPYLILRQSTKTPRKQATTMN